jgi:HEPN domain-containing protein
MNPQLDQARELLDAARRDHVAVRVLGRASESPQEIILFHAQQVVEKSLKAVLVLHQILFPRTHDLLELHALALQNHIPVPAAQDVLLRLSPYAVEFRYLGAKAPTVTLAEATTVVESLLDWAQTCLAEAAAP